MDFAALGIRVDTSSVEKGTSDLDRLAASAFNASFAAEGIGPAYTQAGRAVQQHTTAAQASVGAQNNHTTTVRAATLSTKQYAQALRQVPAQLTDIVTGLISGQPAYLVAIQQGGQLRDVFGGFGNALRGIGTILTPTRIAIGGAAAVGGLLAKAFYDAQREGFELVKTITLSGNAAGVTRDELYGMAEAVDVVSGTQAQAASTLAQLVSTGRVNTRNLQEFAIVAQDLKRTAGQPIEDTVKIFAELGRKPVEAATKLNEQFNFLTIETYKQIRAAEELGDIFAAGEIAQKAFASAMSERTQRLEGELGTLQRIARGTGETFRFMWDRILDIGRPESLKEQVAEVERELANLDRYLARFGGNARATNPNVDRDRAALVERLNALRALQEEERKAAEAGAARKRALEEHIATEKEALEVAKARRAISERAASESFTIDTAAIDRALKDTLSGYSAYLTQLEALRDADQVSEREYFAAKAELVRRDADTRTQALQAESARVEAEIRRLTEARAAAGRAALEAPGGRESDRIKAEEPFNREIFQLRQRTLELETELIEVRRKLGIETQKLQIDETKAFESSKRAIDDARESAESYLRTLERRQQRQLDGLGLGERQRERSGALSDVDERYEDQRLELQRDRRRATTQEQREQIDAELAILDEFHQKALNSTAGYYDELEQRQQDFGLGAQEALNNYLDTSRNVAEQSANLFTTAFRGMEDALVQFATTGKADFKSLANSILADLLRIQLRAAALQMFGGAGGGLGSLFSLFGLFGGGGAVGGLGAGGGTVPTSGGPLYADVGIRRVPRDNQLAVLHKDEAVIPRSMNPFAGGSGIGGRNVTINQRLEAAPGTNVAQFQAVLAHAKAEIRAELVEDLRRERFGSVIG